MLTSKLNHNNEGEYNVRGVINRKYINEKEYAVMKLRDNK